MNKKLMSALLVLCSQSFLPAAYSMGRSPEIPTTYSKQSTLTVPVQNEAPGNELACDQAYDSAVGLAMEECRSASSYCLISDDAFEINQNYSPNPQTDVSFPYISTCTIQASVLGYKTVPPSRAFNDPQLGEGYDKDDAISTAVAHNMAKCQDAGYPICRVTDISVSSETVQCLPGCVETYNANVTVTGSFE